MLKAYPQFPQGPWATKKYYYGEMDLLYGTLMSVVLVACS